MSFRMAQVANIQPSVSQCDVKIQFEPLLKRNLLCEVRGQTRGHLLTTFSIFCRSMLVPHREHRKKEK